MQNRDLYVQFWYRPNILYKKPTRSPAFAIQLPIIIGYISSNKHLCLVCDDVRYVPSSGCCACGVSGLFMKSSAPPPHHSHVLAQHHVIYSARPLLYTNRSCARWKTCCTTQHCVSSCACIASTLYNVCCLYALCVHEWQAHCGDGQGIVLAHQHRRVLWHLIFQSHFGGHHAYVWKQTVLTKYQRPPWERVLSPKLKG